MSNCFITSDSSELEQAKVGLIRIAEEDKEESRTHFSVSAETQGSLYPNLALSKAR
jgi:hypothetical protein